MDYKKVNAPTNTVTRDMADFRDKTGNVYESIAIMGKRANQISVEIKDELKKKLDEFSSHQTTWKKFSRIASRLRSLVTMSVFPSLHLLQHKSLLRIRFTIAIL